MDQFARKHALATEAQISEAEAQIGYKFPPDFRQYLNTHNGGRLNEEFEKNFIIRRSNREDCLFPITNLEGLGYDYDILERTIGIYREEPNWLVPIGSVHGSCKFLIDLRPEKVGMIYLNVNDAPENPSPPFSPSEFIDPDEDFDDEEELQDEIEHLQQFMPYYWYVAESYSDFLKLAGITLP